MSNLLKLSIITAMITSLMACTSQPATVEPYDDAEQTMAADEQTEQSVVSSPSPLPSPPSGYESVIPQGWTSLGQGGNPSAIAEGDLNKDGVPDVAVVIEKESSEGTDESPNRALLIAFGNGDNTYTVSAIAQSAVLRKDEGGVWGDPFESVTMDRGSVLLKHYGGSNWRWYSAYRFRYQDNDFYLIGATEGSYFTGTQTPENADEEDYNLLTGDYVIRKTDESGHTTTTKGNRGRKELVRLESFDIRSEEKQY